MALLFGSMFALGDLTMYQILHDFSELFGIAYQIQDDLEDYVEGEDAQSNRLSIINAIKTESNISVSKARLKAIELYEQYRSQILKVLRTIKNTDLKRLLFRITMRILKDVAESPK